MTVPPYEWPTRMTGPFCDASFSEMPGDRHSVSANASETQPAKLLAVFVVDTNEKELTTPLGN